MSYLAEQVAYLKGLAEGMKLNTETNEGKLIAKIIEVLDDTSNALSELVETQNEMQLQLDDVDADLGDLEDFVYEEDDEYDEYDDDFDYEMIECPNCGEEICLDEDILADDFESFICPSCNEKIEIEFDCDCDDCDCCDCE